MPRYDPIIAILACTLLPLAMLGNPPHRDAITEQIDGMAESSGLSRIAHHLYRDWLNQGAHQLFSVELDAGVNYVMLGACDVDCTDLDFQLLRPDGTPTGRVTGSGGRPVLQIEPTQGGRYQLKATMRQCNIQPCEWGVRVYRR